MYDKRPMHTRPHSCVNKATPITIFLHTEALRSFYSSHCTNTKVANIAVYLWFRVYCKFPHFMYSLYGRVGLYTSKYGMCEFGRHLRGFFSVEKAGPLVEQFAMFANFIGKKVCAGKINFLSVSLYPEDWGISFVLYVRRWKSSSRCFYGIFWHCGFIRPLVFIDIFNAFTSN